MDKIEILEKKIRQAAEQLTSLKLERDQLIAEVKFLEDEQKKTKGLVSERESWDEQKKTIATRVERLIKRLNSLKV